MNTVLLQYAVEVEKTGSITQAAANLFMDQPNLSKAIKSLEETMGAPIFKRTPKGMLPTARGRVFLEHARNVLAQIEEMEHLYQRDEKKGVDFTLSMPRASYIGLAFSHSVSRMAKEDSMKVWLRETNTGDTLRDVESGEYGLGIIRYQSLSQKYYERLAGAAGLVMEPVLQYSMGVLMSSRHPLAQRKELAPGDLMDYVEIVHGDGACDSRRGLERPEKGRKSLRQIFIFERGSQFSLLCENPDTYMWVSPMPRELLKRYSLVEIKDREAGKQYTDALIFRKNYALTKWDQLFLEELNSVKNEFSAMEC